MAMFKKIAGKAKTVSKKDAEKIIKAKRLSRAQLTEEEKEDDQQSETPRKPK